LNGTGIIKSFFFSNYFYGFCVLALSIEASLQQGFALNDPAYYWLVFTGTIVYYTSAYTHDHSYAQQNQRNRWFLHHQKWVFFSQWILTILFLAASGIFINHNFQALVQISWQEIFLLLVFPLIALAYDSSIRFPIDQFKLRKIGWLKPFVIGFVWCGVVTVYPLVFSKMEQGLHYHPKLINWLFVLKNGIFISILCILFDIKDYAADHNSRLKTFVVQYGLRKTLFKIIFPLVFASFFFFLLFALYRHLPLIIILINSIPFVLLIIVSWSMQRRKSILYYLAIIDGLMFVKAACGIIGSLLLK
jgi:hypothetical protein